MLAAAAPTQLGAAELIELMSGAFPAPDEHVMPPLTRPDGSRRRRASRRPIPTGPLVAEVIKTTTDAYVGRVSLVRVFSGTLTPELAVHVCGHGLEDRGHPDHDVDERIGALVSPLGKALCGRSTSAAPATSARSPSSPMPRPATRCRARTTRT